MKCPWGSEASAAQIVTSIIGGTARPVDPRRRSRRSTTSSAGTWHGGYAVLELVQALQPRVCRAGCDIERCLFVVDQ